MAVLSTSDLGVRMTGERPAPQAPSDLHTEVQSDVQPDVAVLATQHLHAGPYPVLRNVFCEMDEGRIVLKGRVGSFYLKQVAQTTVARVAGLVAIENQIEVAIPR